MSETESRGFTYTDPTVKTRQTPTFFFVLRFKFQTAFTGIIRISTSLIVLKAPLTLSRIERLIHVPGTDLSHIRGLGVHSKILTIVIEK